MLDIYMEIIPICKSVHTDVTPRSHQILKFQVQSGVFGELESFWIILKITLSVPLASHIIRLVYVWVDWFGCRAIF